MERVVSVVHVLSRVVRSVIRRIRYRGTQECHSPVSKLAYPGCAGTLHEASEPSDSSCGPVPAQILRSNSPTAWWKDRSSTLFQVFASPGRSSSDEDNAEDGARKAVVDARGLHGLSVKPQRVPDAKVKANCGRESKTQERGVKSWRGLALARGVCNGSHKDHRASCGTAGPTPRLWCKATASSAATVIRSCRHHERSRRSLRRRALPTPLPSRSAMG